MYAIKIVQVHKDDRQLHELLSGKEVKYEYDTYRTAEDFNNVVSKILLGDTHYQYHGHARLEEKDSVTEIHKSEQKNDKVKELVVLSLWDGSDWHYHVIEDSWVFIMLNGKTIDKIEVI